ncbi:MAG: trypsin-like peptidase domain-containing protein [Planctomycetaceae bacterium]
MTAPIRRPAGWPAIVVVAVVVLLSTLVAIDPVPAADAGISPDAAARDSGTEALDDYFAAVTAADGEEAAVALGDRILRDHAADALTLDSLAWGILTDDALPRRDLPLALRAARRAHELTGDGDVQVLETLARALVMNGRRDEGIALHRRAVELCGDDPSTRLTLLEILAEYERPPADPGPTDDERLRRIEDAARRLVASGSAVPVDDLLARTGVEPCRVDLVRPAERPLPSEDLFERVRRSVVVVAALEPVADAERHDISLATGFVIHPSGIIATNFHVVDIPGAPVLAAETADGVVHPVVEILAVSPFADIAICRLGGTAGLEPLALVPDAKPGQRLHALSHPDAALYSFTAGILSRYFVHRADGQAKTMFTTTVDFAVGSSGGPLVDDRGNVVGMVSSTLAVYARDEETREGRRDDAGAPGDFQMGLNMCVPAADILRLVGGSAGR